MFPKGWWSFDLGPWRSADGTYQLFPYEGLPPLDEARFDGTLSWFRVRDAARPFERIEALRGSGVPEVFLRFMGDRRYHFGTCTACEWDPSEAPIPCRVVDGAFTVRFLRDQQDCLFWYLHLVPGGTPTVLCSPIPFDQPGLNVDRDVVLANTWEVAPHFEHFVYRLWLENELWEQVQGIRPEGAAYLSHYRPGA